MAQCTLGADSGMLAGGATAFDVWLHESLCASFDAVLQDPTPEELLAILAAESETLFI